MARNRPTDAELIEAVAEFLETELESEITTSDIRFKLRIARNVLGIVARECQFSAAYDKRERAALQALLNSKAANLDELNTSLCEQIRRGEFDAQHDEIVHALTEITMDKLSIDNPRYSTYKDLKQE